MVDEHILQRVEELRKTASPHEAKHLHGNLITLLKRGRSNKMSPVVKSVLRQRPGRVLDVGCGYGALAIFFAIQGIETTGIDVDQEALKAGNRLAAELGITNITLTPMDACAISLCGFDMALSTDFYEHLAYEHQLMHLRSVWQALKPGGVYVIRAPHRHNIRQQRGDHIGLPSFAGLLQTAYSIREDCLLLICLENGITAEMVEKMADYAPAKIILAEHGLRDDTAMSNAHYILRDRGIELKLV